MPCLCPMCTPSPAPTYTQEYRRACLARAIARMPNDQRIRFLDAVDIDTRNLALDQLHHHGTTGPRQDALF